VDAVASTRDAVWARRARAAIGMVDASVTPPRLTPFLAQFASTTSANASKNEVRGQ
jgi:hypothetical protein